MTLDLTRQTFGWLTVIQRDPAVSRLGALWRCQCQCGTLHVAVTSALRRGNVRSCGCLRLVKRPHMRASEKQRIRRLLARGLGASEVARRVGRSEHAVRRYQ